MLEWDDCRRLENLPADHITHKNLEDATFQVVKNVLTKGAPVSLIISYLCLCRMGLTVEDPVVNWAPSNNRDERIMVKQRTGGSTLQSEVM